MTIPRQTDARHRPAGRRPRGRHRRVRHALRTPRRPRPGLAYGLVRDPADADDLVAETFAKVLATLRAGRGPRSRSGPYLLHHAAARPVRPAAAGPPARAHRRPDPVRGGRAVRRPGASTASNARTPPAPSRKLPERWRAVLWHTEVEGGSAGRAGAAAGLTPTASRRSRYRARERLRQIYLQEHVCRAPSARRAGGPRDLLPAATSAGGSAPRGPAPGGRPPGLAAQPCRAAAAEIASRGPRRP